MRKGVLWAYADDVGQNQPGHSCSLISAVAAGLGG